MKRIILSLKFQVVMEYYGYENCDVHFVSRRELNEVVAGSNEDEEEDLVAYELVEQLQAIFATT